MTLNCMTAVSGSESYVATYSYDGRNRRISETTYPSDGSETSSSGETTETREFYFTNSWQDIEEQVSGSMVDQYVYGKRYVDELICRDDSTPNRYYVMQDANFNVTSIVSTSGSVVERYVYDPYGAQTVMDSSWTVISGSAYDWVVGFQGLQLEVATGLIYVRNRFLHTLLGLWVQRDPTGYVDGLNLYQYLGSNPLYRLDPQGTIAAGVHGRPRNSPDQKACCLRQGGTWASLAVNCYGTSASPMLSCFTACILSALKSALAILESLAPLLFNLVNTYRAGSLADYILLVGVGIGLPSGFVSAVAGLVSAQTGIGIGVVAVIAGVVECWYDCGSEGCSKIQTPF